MEKHNKDIRKIIDANALAFYEKYIPHTFEVRNVSGIKKLLNSGNYDAVVVGSDQVWREGMTHSIGCENFFLKFVPDDIKKIAYSVSMGTNKNEYSAQQTKKLAKLYGRFDAVSVREESALKMFQENGWIKPKAEWTLDPTLLLSAEDYLTLIKERNDVKDITIEKIFCYALDMNDSIKNELNSCGLPYVINGLLDAGIVSIEQWLNNIRCCDMVITDSYHGVVFSIIFGKKFKFMGNARRGNDRVGSLMKILDLGFEKMRTASFCFLNSTIK